ncbi:hypothetical protein B7494_g1937 [Chlorociboria aeruginascens]|nr:hypothetical protein B7494_g1937 [Chlorociboria aeruginascens]
MFLSLKRTLGSLIRGKSETEVPRKYDPVVTFAFDVDGVLLRSKTALPGASDTLSLLQKQGIPYIFLTNSGGLTEQDHAANLSSRLNIPVDPNSFIQSHTPFKNLVPELKDTTILALGGVGNKIRELAKAYGFNNVVTASDIYATYPETYPFGEMTAEHHVKHAQPLPTGPLEIAAIVVFSSPRDWGLDLQLTIDLLLSEKGRLGTVSPLNNNPQLYNKGYQQDSQPALYFCNPDLTWATCAKNPRLAQGSFRQALHGLWDAHTKGASLFDTRIGKPTQATYLYGETALFAHHANLYKASNPGADIPGIDVVYMIGDNPASDIFGSNSYKSQWPGTQWKSILVETGVHTPGTEPAHKPTAIKKNVREAVLWALENEGWKAREDRNPTEISVSIHEVPATPREELTPESFFHNKSSGKGLWLRGLTPRGRDLIAMLRRRKGSGSPQMREI